MSKKYYLVKTDTSFYDPHGTPDNGGTKIEVKYTDKYNDLDLSKIYTNMDGIKVFEDGDDKDWYSQDGYNYEVDFLEIKEITKEEFDNYEKIINNYNNLLKLYE